MPRSFPWGRSNFDEINLSTRLLSHVYGRGLVSCPAPLLEEEGSGDTRGFFVTDWNAISAEWAGFLSCNRKNDVVKLPWLESSDDPYFLFAYSFDIIATGCFLTEL